MFLQRFFAVLKARNLEFLRDRGALGWSFLMPFLIVVGLATSLSEDSVHYKIGLFGKLPAGQQLEFLDQSYTQFVPMQDLDAAIVKVERHSLDLLLDLNTQRYWVNDSSPNGYILERSLHGSGGMDYLRQSVSGQGVRYVDWAVPGVLSMNIMFGALFGVGYVIVRYRKNGVLKRLQATPLNAVEFLSAQLVSRLFLLLSVNALVYFLAHSVLGFTMRGSYLDLLVLFIIGCFSLISAGLIIAARINSEEFAGGLINFISWPMMFLSGVWFSLEGAHPWVQAISQLLPLTHLIQGARAIMIDGANLMGIWPELAILGAMSVVFLSLGAYLFRWQ